MKKNLIIFSLIITSAILLNSCFFCTNGNGDVLSKDRNLSGFDGVVVRGGADVDIIQDGTEKVIVETDENIFANVRTFVENNKLVIETEGNICPTKLTVHVNVDDISYIEVSGAADINFLSNIESDDLIIDISGAADIQSKTITANTINAEISGASDIKFGVLVAQKFKAVVDGAGDITARGKVTDIDMEVSGAGSVNFEELEAVNCKAELSGACDMRAWVKDYANVNLSGAGSFYYKGNPRTDIDVSGAGEIKKID